MTTPDGAYPEPPSEPPAPPTKRRELTRKEKTIGLALAAVTLVAATAGVTALLVGGSDEPSKRAASTPKADPKAAKEEPVEEPVEEATDEEPEALYNPDVSEDDFEMSLKVTRKKCFGSAGCNVTVKVTPDYTYPLWPEPDSSFSLTYEVRGGMEGPVIETLELYGAEDTIKYLPPDPVLIRTANSSVKPTVKITGLDEY